MGVDLPSHQKYNEIVKVFLPFLVLILSLSTLSLFQKSEIRSLINPLIKTTPVSSHNHPEVIGFLPSWTAAKEQNIDLKNLDQVIYFGLGVTKEGDLIQFNEAGQPVYEWTYFTSEYLANVRNLARRSNTKFLLSIKNFDNQSIDTLISNPNYVKRLISNLNSLIKKHELDGLNIDFEYFTDSNFPTSTYLNQFLENLTSDLKKDHPNLLFSFDLTAEAFNDQAYDLVTIGTVMDQVILMAYDYHKADSRLAGPVAPLSAPNNQPSIDRSLNTFLKFIPAQKIILALPLYGYEWQTYTSKYRSPAVSGSGSLATYKRVQELLKQYPDIDHFFDEQSQSPWLIYYPEKVVKQIYYEDEVSLAKKWEFAKEKGLGGVALWALGYEGEDAGPWEIFIK